MILLASVWFIPVYIVLVFSFKKPLDVYEHPMLPPRHPTLDNFTTAWKGSGRVTMSDAFVNSIVITACSVALLLVFGSLAAYALARRSSRLSTGLYLLYVLGFIIPFQLAIVPLYKAMRTLHLLGSLYGMILLYAGLLMPLTVFLYTGFMRVLPREYEESARVDGASQFRTFWRVVFPLLMPVTATVAVLDGVIIWNDFFNPLIFLSGSGKITIPVAIYSFVNENPAQYNLILAGVLVASLPIIALYLFAQRQLIRGFSGGIRG
jgi:raffinose/stachyose/melibiose transport system permease protein